MTFVERESYPTLECLASAHPSLTARACRRYPGRYLKVWVIFVGQDNSLCALAYNFGGRHFDLGYQLTTK